MATDVSNARIWRDRNCIICDLVDPGDFPCSRRALVCAVRRNTGDLSCLCRLALR